MQNKLKRSISGLALVALLAAGNHFFPELFSQLENQYSAEQDSRNTTSGQGADPGYATLQSAVAGQRSEVWFTETEFEVVKILPDDLKGSQHQRFLVARQGLPTLLVAHNIDLAPRAPIEEGMDTIIRGRYEWNKNGLWFPHNDLTSKVAKHNPDLLFFSGDQVYEGASPTMPVRGKGDATLLDYLYKWHLFVWAYRDLTKDIPTITIPDDHDVFQGNIWGRSGRKTDKDDKGGYVESAEFVRMVERTQTSHLPDPFDPTPIEQGIGVYYAPMTLGRVSIAIIEDRKFKWGPNGVAPPISSMVIHRCDFDA